MKTTRCAIYTRKSNEEGLDMAFNSLDAQRETGMDYINSQKHEGWQLVKEEHHEGGFSGGTMKRPGIQSYLMTSTTAASTRWSSTRSIA